MKIALDHLVGSFVETSRTLWWEKATKRVRKSKRRRVLSISIVLLAAPASAAAEVEKAALVRLLYWKTRRVPPAPTTLEISLMSIYCLTPGTVTMMDSGGSWERNKKREWLFVLTFLCQYN